MDEKWKWSSEGIKVLLDDRYKPYEDAWLQSGPVVGVVMENTGGRQFQEEHSKKPVPVGTRFIGHLWVVPEPARRGQGPGHLVVLYDRVEFPNGDKAPVCLLAGGARDLFVDELKDGTGKVSAVWGRAYPVSGWEPERSE